MTACPFPRRTPDSIPHLVLAIAMTVGLSSPAAAQEAEKDREKKGVPDRLLRLLPLGEAPPFRQVIEGGVRKELPPPPGSIPPREVVQMTPEGNEEGRPVRLTLDRLSDSMPARAGTLPLHQMGRSGLDPKPWHELTVPQKTTHALALLWRDPKLKKWDKARSLTLVDDTVAFPAGIVRFVNVAPWSVGINFEGQAMKLAPGKVHMHAGKGRVLRDAPLKVALQDGRGNWRVVFHQAVSQGAGERTNVVIYRADGEAPRRPAKVRVIAEPARLPVPPKPKEGER